MPNTAIHNIDTIIDGQLYIGNLSAAKSLDLRRHFGITHIVSVCPDYSSRGSNHLIIPVQDSEYDDILIHLPNACHFMRSAMDAGGRVLVHCHMGISRSATVVAAYLMSTCHISVHKAIALIKRGLYFFPPLRSPVHLFLTARPQIQPNYGFIKELHAFEACNYSLSPTDATYRAWKRRHRQDVTNFLNCLSDTTVIIPEKLSLTSDFPTDPEQANCLVAYLGLTHCISLPPSTSFPSIIGLKHNHIEIPQTNKVALLLALPAICQYIQDALDNRGRVLIHCLTESTAAVVACAYLMSSRGISYKQAYRTLHDALPLFNATDSFTKLLELYAACNCSPSVDHPVLRDWLGANYQRNPAIPAQPSGSIMRPASPTRRGHGTVLPAPLPKHWTKAGSQAGHTLNSLRPVTLDG
ncbi:protein-tyrosine phosphatase-like protein [Multifurca ochricompacta]|uniref:protein-tyrosine-phosphatase n=1 Tax=Multifurca ochricompacta TaxID=376703 RepID=A0AAD4QSQ0_9AGAM|nr:protein-tyrosine phosphatase-like protein [Multifurca ochricompacta]